LRDRFDGSPDSTTWEPWTKASTRSGNARTSLLSPVGYGTGAGHEPQRESIVYSEFESLKSGMAETLRDKRAEQAADDAVRFDSSIDARSARMECGF